MLEDDDIDFTAKDAAKTVGIGIKIILVVAVLAVVGYAISAAVTQSFIPWQGKIDQQRQTTGDGSYRIAQYNYFHETCGAVQAKEDQIGNITAELKGQPKPSKQRKTVLMASLTALKNTRADLIREYNAKADETDTAGHFRDSNLPYHLDVAATHTVCTAA